MIRHVNREYQGYPTGQPRRQTAEVVPREPTSLGVIARVTVISGLGQAEDVVPRELASCGFFARRNSRVSIVGGERSGCDYRHSVPLNGATCEV